MNPQFHDEFVALCAVFHSGEITEEEWSLLQVHMAYCDLCRRTFDEYKHLVKDVMPAMAASAAAGATDMPRESAASFDRAEQRLMETIERNSSPGRISVSKKTPWSLYGCVLAACLAVLLALVREHSGHRTAEQLRPPNAQTAASRSPAHTFATPREDEDQIALQHKDQELAKLKQELSSLENDSRKSDFAAADFKRQFQVEQAERQKVASEKEDINRQLASAQSDIQELRDKLASASTGSSQQVLQVAALETKVRTLNAALEESNGALRDKERMLALDQDFLSHDREIRDLIGARNLYIADIFDTTVSGKTAKPFGRIFYTQDRSLVFYGFDLEKQAGITEAAAFQAWGSGTDQRPVSLGLFYQDDSHQRWVVRCDDAKTLARLNMVFVTVEPPGGSAKPTGKQLLRAYLQIQPNHP